MAPVRVFRIFVIFLAATVVGAGTIKPCQTYTTLDDPWRATTFTIGLDDQPKCDDQLQPGWYRFAGGSMATACPKSYSCGTRNPVWLRCDIPGPSDGIVNCTTCSVTNNANGGGSCCGQEVTILVRNCGNFVLYYLYSTPSCPLAYCVDAGPVPHNPTPVAPKVLSRFSSLPPILSGPEVINGGFRFNCTVQEVTHNIYDVMWTFDGEPSDDVPTDTLRDGNKVAFLDQRAWVGQVGKELRCSVRVRDDSTNTVGRYVTSDGYWGGIQVNPPTLTVSEGQGPQKVTLTSTLPIVCPRGNRCELQLELDVQGDRWEDIAIADSCILRLRSEDWNARTRRVSTSTRIMATRDFVRDGNHDLSLRFLAVYNLAPSLWTRYPAPEIQIRTLDRETSRCYGYGDPHILGLESTDAYHLYDEGYFVMLRSEQNNFEVQIQTQTCAGRSCICGVAVQHHKDTILVNLCQGQGQLPPEIRILGNEELHIGTTITRTSDGRNYMITFVSGEWVKVTDFRSYLNVEIQVTGSEFDNTSGLCGTFDNNTHNDMTAPDGRVFPFNPVPRGFTESWRLQHNATLFGGVFRPVQGVVPRIAAQQCLCKAERGIVDCGVDRVIMDPARDIWGCTTCDITKDVTRSTQESKTAEEETKQKNMFSTSVTNSLPATTGTTATTTTTTTTTTKTTTTQPVTRETARRLCSETMHNLTLSLQCAGAVTLQLTSFVTSCEEDILSAQNQEFLLAAIAAWESACMSDVIRDPRNYHTDNATGCVEPAGILTTAVCPGQCSLNGQCETGTCVCHDGFAGSDCAVRSDYPPIILGIVGHSVCDVTRRECRVPELSVDNFRFTPDVICRVRDVKMTSEGYNVNSTWQRARAEIITNRQVACHLPDPRVPDSQSKHAFLVSITTDGERFSNEAMYVVFDATCVACDVTGNCSVRTDACLIDGQCYRPDERHSTNSDLLCDPASSNVQWFGQETTPDTVENRTNPPRATLTFTRWDIWTSNQTGCPCHFNQAASTVCACCEAGACQCNNPNMHQCVLCGRQQDCGTQHPAPDFGVDGMTSALTGCVCMFDTSRDDCACCQHGGCQCPRHFRNQCVPCGRLEVCGSKPDVFRPPLA
ncbi:von Willebrand factor D and EGF domain-containing protein-like [Littorina saxatilis]|uniref:von Willebrand factor D and EGF domain-containing protein-like n=1 Tax=Littorina saxatilis TaxID=31220 RepID=UPI0038B4B359